MSRSSATRRYNRTVLVLSLLYAIALIAAEWLLKHHVPGALAYGIAVLPALPIIGIFAAIGRYLIDEQDEYLRMLMVRQTLIASALALSVATIWGFLESFALVPAVQSYFVAVLWFGGLGLGALVNRLTIGRAA